MKTRLTDWTPYDPNQSPQTATVNISFGYCRQFHQPNMYFRVYCQILKAGESLKSVIHQFIGGKKDLELLHRHVSCSLIQRFQGQKKA